MNDSKFCDLCREGKNFELIQKTMEMGYFSKITGSLGLYSAVISNNEFIAGYILESGKFHFDGSYKSAVSFTINNNFKLFSMLLDKMVYISGQYMSVLLSGMDDEYVEKFVETFLRTNGSGLELVKYLKTAMIDYKKYSQFL